MLYYVNTMENVTDTGKKLHIVYLATNLYLIAGGTRVIFEQVNGLAKRGYHVELWQTGEDLPPYFQCDVPLKRYASKQLEKPDIVVMTDPGFIPEVLASRGKKRRTFLLLQHDIEWIGTVSGTDVHKEWFTTHQSYFETGNCEVLVVSAWLQKAIKNKYNLSSQLVRNGIDTGVFHPEEPLVRQTGPMALLVYDPQDWKGFGDAMNALMGIRRPNLKIAMIGSTYPITPYAEGQYYGFSFPSMYFCRPDQDQLARIYSAATVFISPSWKEGFGLPGLEALACGVPLVTTDSGGVRDYASPEKTAVVVPPKDVPALRAAVIRVLDDKQLRTKLIKNGLKKAAEFDWESSITKLETIFSEPKS